MWMITKFTSHILSIIFPSYCYLCHKEGKSLCMSCLEVKTRSYDTPHPFIRSMYSFKDPAIKKIIHAIKYFHRKDLIPPLAEVMTKEFPIPSGKNVALVPIPMPRIRKYMRGYNQAEALATAISHSTHIPIRTNILIRSGIKKRQVRMLSRKDRIKNQHGAFSAKNTPDCLHIILVDDVTTTGATLQEARRVLMDSGALSVSAITIAH